MKKKAPPSAAYTHRVAMLTALKLCERNSSRGSIGARARDSHQTKTAEADHPADQRAPDHRRREALQRLLDQREHRPGEAERRERDPDAVDPVHGIGVGALVDRAQREPDRDRDQRQVDPEDPAPVELDQQATAGRADQGRDPRPRRPQPDRATARLALEGRGEDRQRARDQQRAGHPLQRPGSDQRLVGGRDRAQDRGRPRTRRARSRTSAGGRTGRRASRRRAAARPAPACRPRRSTAGRRARCRDPPGSSAGRR